VSFNERYGAWAKRSGELFEEASTVIPGGAGSSARTVKFGWKPYPPFMASGTGSRIRDVDGHEFVDYLLGLGPMILGHRHPTVTAAVADAIQVSGTCFGLPYELEIEAARKVVDAVPGIDLIRFTNSGSEAVGSAVRIARAYTGRRLIIRFEGHYHGWQDTVYWSNHVNPAVAGPASRPRPVPSGPGVPAEHGVPVRPGGAQEYFGVNPDLTTLAKGLGGGFPVAAVGGSEVVMSIIADGRYSHSGTYNANVVACAAVSATMDLLAEPGLYQRQLALGQRLMDGLRDLAEDAGLPVIVEGLGTVFQLWFTEHPIRNWRDAERYAREDMFTTWWQEMLLRGVLFHPSQFENLFLSLVHDDADVDQTLTATAEAFAAVRRMPQLTGAHG